MQKIGKIEPEELNTLKNERYVGKRTAFVVDEILRRIVQNPGGINAYEISRISPRIDRITVMRCIRRFRLVEERYVRVEKGKRNSKRYFITFIGILHVLHRELSPEDTEKSDYRRFRSIIKKCENWLPLVFGKWSFFRRVGIEETALSRLKTTVAVVVANQDLLYGFIKEPLAPHADIKTTVTWFFYFLGLIPVGPEFEDWQFRHGIDAWLSALKQDKDIQAYFMEELEHYYRRLESLSTIIAHVTEVIGEENVEKPRGG